MARGSNKKNRDRNDRIGKKLKQGDQTNTFSKNAKEYVRGGSMYTLTFWSLMFMLGFGGLFMLLYLYSGNINSALGERMGTFPNNSLAKGLGFLGFVVPLFLYSCNAYTIILLFSSTWSTFIVMLLFGAFYVWLLFNTAMTIKSKMELQI